MANWVLKGLAKGVVTAKYPSVAENIPGAWCGYPEVQKEVICQEDCKKCLQACPTGAVTLSRAGRPVIDYQRCLFCGDCVHCCPEGVLAWENDFRLAALNSRCSRPHRFSRRSVYIRHIDGGCCEACLWEVNGISNPYYDLHRLGFFFVTSPRHADVLLVTGPVTGNMRGALEKAYRAMAAPKLVLAAGSCACSGTFAGMKNYASPFRLADLLPVDIFIPGCPPSPLTLLHGLLLAIGRAGEERS